MPNLVTNPGSLSVGVVRGQERLVTFTLTNTGGAPSGNLTVQLPGLPWLTVASSVDIASLAPSESTSVSLLLNPPADQALELYNGTIVIGGANTSVPLGFAFRTVSEAKGDITVTASDDFTYFAAGAPKVAGALVQLLDPFDNSIVVASATTGDDGTATFTDVNEGSYLVRVTADKHDQYQATQVVVAGQTTSVDAFIRRQTVTYQWTVVPTQIQDQYTIQLQSTFETNVPAPVITIDAIDQLPDLAPGGLAQFDATITNHGLIAVQDVQLELPTHPEFVFSALSTDLGSLPAMSSITVPVTVRRLSPALSTSAADAGSASAQDAADAGGVSAQDTTGKICVVYLGTLAYYVCGQNGVYVHGEHQIDLYAVNDCSQITPTSFFSVGPFFPEPLPVNVTLNYYPTPKVVDTRCNNCTEEVLDALVACPIGYIPVIGDFIVCIGENAKFLYNALTARQIGSFTNVATTEISCALAVLDVVGVGEVLEPISLINNFFACIDAVNELKDCVDADNGTVSASSLSENTASASGLGLQIDTLIDTATLQAGRLKSLIDPLLTMLGDDSWIQSPADGPDQIAVLRSWLTRFFELIDPSSDSSRMIGDDERAELLALPRPSMVSVSQANEFIDRWNRTMEYWDQGILRMDDVPIGQSRDFIDAYAWAAEFQAAEDAVDASKAEGYSDPSAELVATYNEILQLVSGQQQGTCAQVKIEIDQSAVLTRSAFAATLEITNGNTANPILNTAVHVTVTDTAGNDVTDRFGIKSPQLSGLSAVDGSGVIAPGGSGSATYTLVPTEDAAPLAPTVYYVGGTLEYTDPDSGLVIDRALVPSSITVQPDPHLTLDYFEQRDVIGDDPFTSTVEASQPFDLGLIVRNTGRGTAQDFTITSAQPKIIDNEKGLLINFQIVGSQVGDQPATPSLTVDLGTIGPGQTQVAKWQLTSSLQGRFIDYDATFKHTDDFGNSRTSLIDQVNIHELIHTVLDTRPGADDKLDFLVNDIQDLDVLPDTLYLSDGTTAAVNVATNAAADHSVTLNNRTVHLTANMTSGWDFLRLPDPAPVTAW